MNLEGLSREELLEIKLALNTQISQRIVYSNYETNKKRLDSNKHYLEMDYNLLGQVIETLEENE